MSSTQLALTSFLSTTMGKYETNREFDNKEIIIDNTIIYNGEHGEKIAEFRVNIGGELFDIIVKEV